MKNKKLMTHLYYGDVSPEYSEELAISLIIAGADVLEIGIPYSDPVSDGPVFQKACGNALEKGITPHDVFTGIKRIRRQTDNPIYLTSYFGPIFKIGVEKFLRMAKACEVNGLIIPDFPLEEQENFYPILKKSNLRVIQFATVYSNDTRLKQIIDKSDDFIYCVSLPGVTGDNINDAEIGNLIIRIKEHTFKKIYCGFGIRTPQDVGKIVKMGADGVIVGSAIAEIYQNQKDPYEALIKIESLVRDIKKGMNSL